ncbi:MAG: U32 family peptidase [Firmicutes bacterium]|nr:U32 family peptidase [Bacillota bacterium]
MELLSPAGNFEKLKTALHYGANAVYFASRKLGLRAYADNFSTDEIVAAVKLLHSGGKKAYVAVNVIARNADFGGLVDYLKFLESAKVDAIIVSDFGILDFAKRHTGLDIHISTQANITNKYAARFMFDMGAKRVVLARELSLGEIADIKAYTPKLELEAFVHGAMCIAYSGRCLLSNYLNNRGANSGQCSQPCRWEYGVSNYEFRIQNSELLKKTCAGSELLKKTCAGTELLTECKNNSELMQAVIKESGRELVIEQDSRGTYILNSKDLNMLRHLDKMADAGITSFKIEGRMKSAYYVAAVTNAYRGALDLLAKSRKDSDCKAESKKQGGKDSGKNADTDFFKKTESLEKELHKVSNRGYTTAFYLGDNTDTENFDTSLPKVEIDVLAQVEADICKGFKGNKDFKGYTKIIQRNKFLVGDTLEVLSPNAKSHNKQAKVIDILDESGSAQQSANKAANIYYIKLDKNIITTAGDFLRST